MSADRKFAVATPSPEDCRRLRAAAALTQEQMAELLHMDGRRGWYRYESGERGCDLRTWELALLLTGQHPQLEVIDRDTGPRSAADAAPLPTP